jgi:hypothetical protein
MLAEFLLNISMVREPGTVADPEEFYLESNPVKTNCPDPDLGLNKIFTDFLHREFFSGNRPKDHDCGKLNN